MQLLLELLYIISNTNKNNIQLDETLQAQIIRHEYVIPLVL